MKSCDIILASASPRRKELLKEVFPSFKISAQDAPEAKNGRFPSRLTMKNALAKARCVKDENALIIAADTVVYMDGKYYFKPSDEADACRMLKELSGRTHFVYTGVAIKMGGECRTFYDKSAVKIKKLSDDEIKSYVSTGSPLDKAGAYGVQDGLVVERFSGSFSNIMGLPVEKLKYETEKFLRRRYGSDGIGR